jgi:hypothetical protein
MKLLHPHRLAAILLVVFCAGHTAGGMLTKKSLGPAADAVRASMQAVHFSFNGADCTWYGFWFAFGLITSVFLLLSAALAWWLAGVEARHARLVTPIAWVLVVAHIANAVLTWSYFFAGAGAIATVVTVLLAAGAGRLALRSPPPP